MEKDTWGDSKTGIYRKVGRQRNRKIMSQGEREKRRTRRDIHTGRSRNSETERRAG
jgi:hypothetical protein